MWLVQDSIHNWANWIAGLYYTRHCLDALATLPNSDRPQIVAFVPEPMLDAFFESASFVRDDWLKVIPVTKEHWQGRAGLAELARTLESQQCDILFPAISPPCVPFSGHVIAWITDYQHKYFPEFFPQAELDYREQLFSFMVASSTRIACSSQVVLSDMEKFYPASQGRGSILRFATRPPNSALELDPRATMDKFQIASPYAYLPYQFWKHKNHWTAFRAWRQFCQQNRDCLLVCTGATQDSRSPQHFEEIRDWIADSGMTDSIRILGMVSREDQWQLYRNSKLVLQPSLFEGWSTSVEEARSLGKPVVLSNIDVHREQMAQTGHFFEPLDTEGLAELLNKLWHELPAGYDAASERDALQQTDLRVRAFGRALLDQFQQTLTTPYPKVAAQVLPLYLLQQTEAVDRLRILESIDASNRELRGQVAQLQQQVTSLQEQLDAAYRASEEAAALSDGSIIQPDSAEPGIATPHVTEEPPVAPDVRPWSWLRSKLSRRALRA